MSATGYVLLGLLVLVVLAGIWGLVSRRRSIPCPTWLGWLVELDNPFTKTNRAAVIVQRLDVDPGMTVLDFGCGPGRLAILLAKAVGPQGEVVAVDIAAGMLDRAREKARAAKLANIRFLQAAAGEGKLGRNRFDRALLVTVLGEIPDRHAALKEIYDALKPGGVLSVTEVMFDPHFQTRPTVARLAGAVGFKQKAFYGHPLAFALNLEKPPDGA